MLVLCSFYAKILVSFNINYYLCRQNGGRLTLIGRDELRIINLNIIILKVESMRKVLLFATALCLSSAAMAQTSIESALDAQKGENTYKVESSEAKNTYWKFTADKNYLAKVSPLSGSSNVPTVFTSVEGTDSLTLGGAGLKYPSKAYALEKGKTYYFIMNMTGESGFNLDLSEMSSYGKGLSQDNPAELKVGEELFLGNPLGVQYENTTAYVTYTAEKTAQLQLSFSSYVAGATVNGNPVSAEYDQATGGYVLKVSVEQGKTYSIALNLQGSVVANSKLVEVKAGSLEMPFALNEGENKVPAEMGDYYFTYTPNKTGYLNISSDAVLAGGQVKVYTSLSNITYQQVAASSESGTYNVRVEIPYTGSTYYIVVNKLQNSDAEDVIKAEMQEYQPGETVNTAFELTELPVEKTLPSAKGTYYYKLTVPANTEKFVTVETDANLDAATSIIFYNQQNGEYGAATVKDGLLKTFVGGQSYDITYILKVTANEDNPLAFKVSYLDVEKGSLATNPAEAVEGENEITVEGTEYFKYTATKNGKLNVEVEPGVTVSFPRGTGMYDGEYTAINKGTDFFIEATAGTTYLIKVSGAAKGTTMYLEEKEFSAGESRTNPIVMEDDEYTFTKAGAADLWLQYNVTEDGVLDFACDQGYNGGSDRIEVFKNEEPYGTTMMGTENFGSVSVTVYKGKVIVSKGDKLYIHCVIAGKVTGSKIQFTKHEAEPGETVTNPLVITKGKTVTITGASRSTPVWMKASLPAGTTTFRLSGYLMTALYNSLEDAKNGANAEEVRANYVQLPDGSYVYEFTKEMAAAGDVYFQFVDSYGATDFTWMDNEATGIWNIEAAGDSKVSIFKMDGTQVNQISGNGVYIIKSNGKTKKIVVKK